MNLSGASSASRTQLLLAFIAGLLTLIALLLFVGLVRPSSTGAQARNVEPLEPRALSPSPPVSNAAPNASTVPPAANAVPAPSPNNNEPVATTPAAVAPNGPQPVNAMQPAACDTSEADEVLNYLTFVKQFEVSKRSLIRREQQALNQLKDSMSRDSLSEIGSQRPIPNITRQAIRFADNWRQLAATFGVHIPPDSCRELYNKYLNHLNMMLNQIESIERMLGMVTDDADSAKAALEEAKSMRGMSTQVEDAIQEADIALSTVCCRYRIAKDFQISGSDR